MSRLVALVLLFIAATAACAPERQILSREDLQAADRAEFVPNEAYLPAAGAGPARHAFSGTLVIPEHAMRSEPAVILPVDIQGKKPQLFPAIDLAFVSHDGYLVPARRGILVADHGDSYWQIQVMPGKVWSEPADDGMSRASFPFALTSIIENETYDGVATFLYDDKEVSSLRYQIVQQLAPFVIQTRFLATGQTPVRYRPGPVGGPGLLEDFDAELADRLPWRDWTELEQRYGAALFDDFDSGRDPALTLTSGLVIDGTVYVRSMNTRFGPYPYPREMLFGVWSVTKTAAGMVTLMHLAQKYGDQILDYRIRDYLDVTATHHGWDEVRFRDASSMATGIGTGTLDVTPNVIGSGDASDPENDAGVDDYMAWYFAPTLKEKLALVFRVPSYPWGPGVNARYRDRDIFTLSAAMESLYKRREGADADLWQMMLDEVYRPIGIHHLSMTRTREPQGLGTPILAWGLYVRVDDIAKIAMLLQNGGMHDGVQLLSQAGLAESFYDTPVRGLPTGESNRFGQNTYHLSLWQEWYEAPSGHRYAAPRMVGYGGNLVQMMPNGMIGFRMGSGGDVPDERMTEASNAIRPFDDYDRRGRRRVQSDGGPGQSLEGR
jgi:hypothetical protein